MKRLVLFLLLSAAALAQTTVTATVVDPNGNPYANGTGSAYTVVASGQQSVTIAPSALTSSGAYSAAMAAGTYVFTFCSAPVLLGVPTVNLTPKQICFSSAPIAVSGSSLNITSSLSPVVIGPPFFAVLAPQYKELRCEDGFNNAGTAIPAGTIVDTFCYNDSGVIWTITGIKCFVDLGSASTLNAAGHTLGVLLTGAIACGTGSFAAGTQSANVLLTSGDWINFTFVADGTATRTTWVVSFTQ